VRGRVDICDNFLTRLLCVFRCPVWGAAGGVWERPCEAWRVPAPVLCSFWIHLH
jgi:hypothetical protein